MSYRLIYRFEAKPDGIERRDIPDDHGACDMAMVVSIIGELEGALSFAVWSVDGRTKGALDDAMLFQCWVMLAKDLAESASLVPGRRELCALTFRIVRDAILSGRST